MLQEIRDKSSGWFSWVIIGIIVIVFALFGVSRYIGGGGNTNTVATVNGQPISTNQVQSMYYQLQSMAQQRGFYSSTQSFADLLKKQALQQVIQTEALLQAAKKGGFLLSPIIVQAAIESVPDFNVKGQFSYQKWQAFVNTNPNANVFIQSVQNDQLLNQLESGFVTTAFTTPDQLARIQAYLNQERHLGFFTVPLSLFSTPANASSLAEQKRYYIQHAQDFLLPAQVKISYIDLSLKTLMNDVKPTEQQLQAYYQDNLSQYQLPAKWQLEQTTVSQSAQAKTSADHSKTIWVSANDMGPDLQKIVSGLTKIGQVSQPVQTSEGTVIYKLLAQLPEKQLSFEDAKERVTRAYKQEQAQSQFDNDSDQLANLTFSQPNTLEPAAKALGLPVNTSGYFTRHGGSDALTKDPNLIQVAFSHDVLVNRNNSQVINVGNNAQVVIRVEDYKPDTTKPFESVQADIEQILTTKMQIDQARQLSDTLSKAVLNGTSPSVVAADNHVQYTDLGFVNRHAKQDPQILQAGFSMPLNQKTWVLPGDDRYNVLVLEGVRSQPLKNTAKEKQQLSEAISMSEGQLAYQLYQHSVIKNAKVKILN